MAVMSASFEKSVIRRVGLLLQQANSAEKVALPVTPPNELAKTCATETDYVHEASKAVKVHVITGRLAARARG
jgi:hypothetical protein